MRVPYATLALAICGLLVSCGSEKSPTGLEESSNPISLDPIRLSQTTRYNLSSTDDPQTMVISKTISTCAGTSTVVTEDTLYQFLYEIKNGQLYLWDTLQCNALLFGGGHIALDGSWTYRDTAAFPIEDWTARLNPNCTQIDQAPWANANLNLTSTQAVLTTVTDSFCLAKDEPVFQDLQDRGITGAAVTATDCSHFSVRYGSNEGSLEITAFDRNTGDRNLTLRFKDKSCSLDVAASNGCATGSSNTSAFSLCVLQSGLLDTTATAP